jgi:hypothetical protein
MGAHLARLKARIALAPMLDRGFPWRVTDVEALLVRPIDLVEAGAVLNPYLRRGIEQSRELVYAA